MERNALFKGEFAWSGKEGDGRISREEGWVGFVLKFLLRKAKVNNWKAHGPLLDDRPPFLQAGELPTSSAFRF